MTLLKNRRLLAWLAMFVCAPASAQDMSFAQPPLEHHTVALVLWTLAEGGNGHFYEVVSSPGGINWPDAESYAEAHGGYLATITSARENTFVFKLIDSAQFWLTSASGDSRGPWLGGRISAGENSTNPGWQWLNHEGAFTYTNWTPGPPANPPPNSRLIFFGPGRDNRQPTWSFAAADQHLSGFVVEYDTDPLPSTLKYVAIFGVSVVGFIALGGVVYFVLHARQRKTVGKEHF
jgi:hypothetical protein